MNQYGYIKRKSNLTIFEKIYIVEIFKGLLSVIREIFRPKVTYKFPEERYKPKPSFRGRPVLVQEDSGGRCVACGLCARVCPALAIEVRAAETEKEKERYPEKFEINMVRCIFCGFCEEVCPEEAIVMSDEYLLVFNSQKEALFGKDKLMMPIEKLKPRLEWLKAYR
jgi:NADH-quinone oxidoreductase subunit I